MIKESKIRHTKTLKSAQFESVTLKTLSVAALAGLAFGTPAVLADTDVTTSGSEGAQTFDISKKPIDQGTLDYLHENNVKIPQKAYQKDENGKLVLENNEPIIIDGEPIKSPISAYTITAGTESDHSFEYKTADEQGSITSSYYKIELRNPEQSQGASNPSNSDDLKWSETPLVESEYTTTGSVDIKLSDTETKTFYYGYTKPSSYTTVENQYIEDSVTNPVDTWNNPYILLGGAAFSNPEDSQTSINKVLYQNNTAKGIYNVTTQYYYCESATYGGAVYNKGELTEVIGDFVNNSVTGSVTGNAYGRAYSRGGAIANLGKIGDITSNFINNSAGSSGGAIFNGEDAQISDITGNFINNSASGAGAIHNQGTIGDITGDFIGNYAYSDSGAIYNSGTMGNITGNFIGNYISSYKDNTGQQETKGSAIYNDGIMGSVTGDFIGNRNARTFENYNIVANIYGDFISNNYGGLLNKGNINNITGNFIHNETMYRGGGVNNSGIIKLLQGNFISNYSRIFGGGIHNTGKIDKVKGNFIGNYTNNYAYGSGGAISNNIGGYSGDGGGQDQGSGIIGIIEGDFISNHVDIKKTENWYHVYYGQGGALYNEGYEYSDGTIGAHIDKIIGNFIDNRVTSNSYADGGAIHNSLASSIDEIQGSFIRNYVEVYENSEYYSQGGAIQNLAESKIGKITGDFIGNYTKGSITSAGGAIFNSKSAEIGYIKGNFENNSAEAIEDGNYSQGGAIYNSTNGVLKNIEGNFIANHVGGTLTLGGGAIYNNNAVVEKVTGNFQDNYASGKTYVAGGAVYNYCGKINELNGSFINNYAKSQNGTAKGGAIFSLGTTTLVADAGKTNVIDGNYVEDKNGKRNEAVYVSTGREFQIEPTELKRVEGSGYGFYNKYTNLDTERIPSIFNSAFNIVAKDNGTFVINDIINGDSQPGSIDYDVTTYYSNWDGSQRVYVDLDDNFLIREKITSEDEYDDDIEDWIYTSTSTYTNENGDLLGSKVVTKLGSGEGDGTTTYYDANGNEVSKLPFEEFAKFSSGTLEYNVNFDGDSSGKIFLNNNIIGGANVSLSNTNMYLGRDNVLNGNNLTLNSGYLSMINNSVGVSALNKMTVNGNTDFVADVDLKNKEMDRFTAKSYGKHLGNVNVTGMNLLSDSNQDEKVTAVYFTQPGLKNHVTHNGLGELPDENQTTVYTPIYKYNVVYDVTTDYGKGDGGYFVFSRGGGGGSQNGGNPSEAFNPAVLTTPVNTVAASQAGMTEAFKYVFEHIDAFTQLPADYRISKFNANKYALAEQENLYNGISTDFNSNKGSFNYDESNKAYWLRPYTTFENMSLRNGPKVDVITYGSLIGYDGDFTPMKHGWHRIGTAYIGYNGAQIKYKGADTTTNGGLIGFTETYYKGNFWSGITLSAGASVGDTRTMYGKEDYATLLAGVASKTGYNFEFKQGKYILQPIMYLSYTFAKTFDYTNAAGVRVETDPAHSLQLHPIIRGVANCKNGWQPYVQVGVVWNALNKANITANGIKMPEMSMKPYVEYGVGLQRNWKDKFTAFGQAMIRNGGRNGIALTAGFRWAIGRDKHEHNEKVQAPESIKVGKVKNQTDKLRDGARSNKGIVVTPVQTSTKTVIKQLTPAQKAALCAKYQNTTRTTNAAIIKSL